MFKSAGKSIPCVMDCVSDWLFFPTAFRASRGVLGNNCVTCVNRVHAPSMPAGLPCHLAGMSGNTDVRNVT